MQFESNICNAIIAAGLQNRNFKAEEFLDRHTHLNLKSVTLANINVVLC